MSEREASFLPANLIEVEGMSWLAAGEPEARMPPVVKTSGVAHSKRILFSFSEGSRKAAENDLEISLSVLLKPPWASPIQTPGAERRAPSPTGCSALMPRAKPSWGATRSYLQQPNQFDRESDCTNEICADTSRRTMKYPLLVSPSDFWTLWDYLIRD